MKNLNLQTGRLGEDMARIYLKERGFRIIEQNYETKYGEIDLVVSDGKELIFVEVRTKIGENFGTPENSLDKRKLRKLWWNAKAYAAFKKWQKSYRIDAVCVVLKSDLSAERISHYENIL